MILQLLRRWLCNSECTRCPELERQRDGAIKDLSFANTRIRQLMDRNADLKDTNDEQAEQVAALIRTGEGCEAALTACGKALDGYQANCIDLDNVPRNAAEWKQLDTRVTEHFKAPVTLIPVDMPKYFKWFHNEVYPHIRDHDRGQYSHDDSKKMNSCSKEDFVNVLKMSFANMIPWVESLFDCENIQRKLRTELEYKYGITSYKTLYGDNVTPHAFGIMYFTDDTYFLVEPQTDGYWLVGREPSEYDKQGWYNHW